MELGRSLRRGDSFPWIVIALLALGVGATTAMFSVVNGVLLRPLNFPDPGQLVLVGERVPQIPGADKFAFFDTPAAFFAWRREADDFAGLAAIQSSAFTLAGVGRPRLLRGARVSVNFFEVLLRGGARPQLGRLLVPSDETDATHPMVITDALWRSAFNADPGVIGRRVGAPGKEGRVVGVLPPDFRLAGGELGPMLAGEPTEYFDALHFGPGDDQTSVFSDFNYTVLGRLRPGVGLSQALAQLNVIQANLARGAPEKLSLFAQLSPVREYAVAGARQALWLLLAGIASVLLIVCVNLGGLWTTRIADCRRDWAIRIALGADPGRLVRGILGESVGLALLGGVVGVGVAALSLRGLIAAAPADLPRLDEVHMDWRVFGFGMLLALLAGLMTGLAPALRLARGDPQASLKAGGAASTADRASLRSRQGLIALQAGLATLLLAAAGLLGLSFYRLLATPTGFVANCALQANIAISSYTDAQRDQILRRLPAAAASVPGVTAAAFTSHLPLQGETWVDSAGVPGRVYSAAEVPQVNVRFVSPGYFAAMGIPLRAGRDLAESDRPAGWPPKNEAAEAAMPGAVVLSRAAARALWPGDAPSAIVGRKIKFNGQTTPTVVGIAEDVRDGAIAAAPPSVIYQPYWENTPYSVSLVVDSSLPAAALAAPLRAAIWGVAPNAPIPVLRSLGDLEATAVAPQRYQLALWLLFAGLALALAAMGVYALVAHSVARRRKELAVRISLGARAGDIWRLVLRQALVPVIGGVAGGLGAALVFGRLLDSLLFEVSAANPAVLAAVAAAVLLAGFAACLLPARRAIHTDPLAALHAD